MSIAYPLNGKSNFMSTTRLNSRGIITRRKMKVPAPLTDINTCNSTAVPKPFLSPPLAPNARSRKLEQFFGDRVLVDNLPSKTTTTGFRTITQSWIPLCYFIRFAYSKNLLQNLLCYLEIDRVLSTTTNNQLEFLAQSEKLHSRFFSPVNRLKLPKEFLIKYSDKPRLSREFRGFLNDLKLHLADFFSDFYISFEKDRIYFEMFNDLESNFGYLADLKLKALRQLDSELGIFTHNFEELPNVDLLYQFRKNVLMVQPSINFKPPKVQKERKRSLSRATSPVPYLLKDKEKSNSSLENDLHIKVSLYDKLDSLMSGINNNRDGYSRLDN
ncbi:hypothetical protein K502DRAFT_363587 [Neoconidiobolus thromboides FSU 785]|nr:hypothetical protein K502DRAFT_363587 [Neoconidiobolus thromboides FSU 785]